MDLLVYAIFVLMAILAASALYILISRPKEIVFSILNILKSEPVTLGGWLIRIVTSPIWYPLLLLDKKNKWGIYEDEITDYADDDEYQFSSKLYVNFNDYQKFILIERSSKYEILASLDECYSTTPDLDIKVKLNQSNEEDFVLQINQSARFYDFNYLVQWFSTFCANAETIGIAISNVQEDISFYLISDKTKNHINSYTGKTLGGLNFSVYLLSDYERGTWLGLNEEIKLDRDLDFSELILKVSPHITTSNKKSTRL